MTFSDIVEAVNKINRGTNEIVDDPEIATRIAQYEMAFQMQGSVPELMDTTGEPEHPRVSYVAGLESPEECFRNIVGWLVGRGYADTEIEAVVGGNIIRALREIWPNA